MEKQRSFKIFRKQKHSDHLIRVISNHLYEDKMAAFNSIMHRHRNITMSKKDSHENLYIKFIATKIANDSH